MQILFNIQLANHGAIVLALIYFFAEYNLLSILLTINNPTWMKKIEEKWMLAIEETGGVWVEMGFLRHKS